MRATQFSAAAAVERAMNGLTQTEIAARMGVTQACISYWRSGKRTPKLNDMAALLEATGATWAHVFASPPEEAVVVGFRAGLDAAVTAIEALRSSASGPAA